MARIRSIKPEMADDAKLASVSRDARYTFVLLISKADDDGLLLAGGKHLLLLYPYDTDATERRVRAWIDELVGIGVARWRSTRDGVPVVELVNWAKHQRIDNKGRNTLRGTLIEVAANNGEAPRLADSRGDSRNCAESRGLDREREVDREVGGGEGKGKGAQTVENGKNGAAHAAVRANALVAFAEAWALYPRRAGANSQRDAERAFLARVKAGDPVELLLSGVRRYRAFCEHEQQIGTRYVMQASRFFGPSKPYEEGWDVADGDDADEARVASERAAVERDEKWIEERRATAVST